MKKTVCIKVIKKQRLFAHSELEEINEKSARNMISV